MRTRLLGTLLAAAVALGGADGVARAAEDLKIGDSRGKIEFAIGDSRIFRTTGSFKNWQGKVQVDDADVGRSTVEVTIRTASIQMMDKQQTEMLKDTDFFSVERFPQLTFRSTRIERTSDTALKVEGLITMRGITRPMTLDVTVSDRRRDAPPGARYARFTGKGVVKRSEFGMTKFVDMVGDEVEFSISTDAWR
jgi:polyisoprenoid-binding protein YceI